MSKPYRLFNGKRYYPLRRSTQHVEEAKQKASVMRDAGHTARVIAERFNGRVYYRIYTRNSLVAYTDGFIE